MKNLFNKSLIVFLMLCFNMVIAEKQLLAQSQTGIASMNVKFKQHINPANAADTLDPTQDIIYTVIVNDTTKVKKIYLNAGTSQGGSDIFSYDVKFNNQNTLPQGITYQRTGSTVVLTITSQHVYADYFYEAKTEDPSGNFSNPLTYHF